ncbi:MAG TPA: tetratricopeptide repeat protein, partial [Allosphingosinicella sp.]|nr:tetratricopeptide repeat protein [Allosphingosinicella sp.]
MKDRPEESAKRKAITYFEQAQAIYEELGDDTSAATTLINIGWLYDQLNLKADAVKSYSRAHSLYKKSNDQLGMASALNSAGWAYRALGDKQSALANYFIALEIYRHRPDRQGEAITLRSIGAAYLDLGRNSEALSYLLPALKIEIEIDNEFTRFSRAATLDDIATAYKNLSKHDEALKHYAEALRIFRRYRIPGAGTIYKMGLVYLALGNKDAALGQFMEALFAAYSTTDRETETNILSSLMSLWATLGNPRLAVFYGKQSVNLSQSLRANIKILSPDLQRAYLKSIENTYRTLADLLAAEGRIPEAQQVLAMLKEEEYSQFVQRTS